MCPFRNTLNSHEKNVPALPKASCPSIWFLGAHSHQGRSCHSGSPPGEGPHPPRRWQHDPQVRPPHASLSRSPLAAGHDHCAGLASRQRYPDVNHAGASQSHEIIGLTASGQSSFAPSGSSPSQTLPRARIIRRRSVFDTARIRGRRFGNRWMALNVLPIDSTASDAAAVAFLTPKRLGSATMRNRLRRRMREIYRRRLALQPEAAYLVWVARPPALELDFEALTKCMAELRKKALD
jgi:ribonuclease P protein component